MTALRHPTWQRAARFTPVTLALMAMASWAQAQSLQELHQAAQAYDATYLAAKSLAESSQAKLEQAYALGRPSVNLTAGLNRSTADTPYSSTKSANTTSTQVGLGAQYSLFNRANSLTIDQAEQAIEVSKAQLQAAEQDLIVRVAQAYFDVLASQDALATVQASKKAIAEQLASAKRNFEVGTATITDTREAQARYDLAVAQELAADNDLRVKRLALEQLVGRSDLAPSPLAVPVVLPPVTPAEPAPWLTAAEQNSPSVKQARLGHEVAKLETEKARAGNLPTVVASASIGKSHVSVDGSLVTGPYSASGNGTSTALGVTLNWPLFAGYAIQNKIKETLLLEDKARNDLEGARRAVAQGTRSAFFGVQSGWAQVKALEAAESSSKLALEATQLGYKVGVRVNLDVLNAQTQLFQTQRDLAKARYDLIVGGLKLRQVSGQLTPSDVQAVNALLVR